VKIWATLKKGVKVTRSVLPRLPREIAVIIEGDDNGCWDTMMGVEVVRE